MLDSLVDLVRSEPYKIVVGAAQESPRILNLISDRKVFTFRTELKGNAEKCPRCSEPVVRGLQIFLNYRVSNMKAAHLDDPSLGETMRPGNTYFCKTIFPGGRGICLRRKGRDYEQRREKSDGDQHCGLLDGNRLRQI